MRYLLFLFPVMFVTFSCVKPPSTDPVPLLEYKDVSPLERTTLGGGTPRDTAVLIVRYADGDGDLFRNSSKDPPNVIYWTLAFNADSNKFIRDQDIHSYNIPQPANGYYKGKAIHGDVYIPMRQIRSSDKIKVIKFEVFMVDMQDHKSNVVTTPVFTLSF
jgi:hypothetical protein